MHIFRFILFFRILFYQNKDHNVRQIRFHICIKTRQRNILIIILLIVSIRRVDNE